MPTLLRTRCLATISLLMTFVSLLGVVAPARAGGPRFTTAAGWGVPPGHNVVWGTTNVAYYTDPGALNAAVSHAQADAMVAAAAAVWAVPTSSVSFSYGGQLAEHVSTANTYFDGTQLVFPADVQVSNEANVPVAIIYDTNGGLVDLLLGGGSSDPLECRQNAVIGDIDDIQQYGDSLIHHATLILNGRCVGNTPEQLTQMQYQLARAFGRVLGLAWSQTNDNVFTALTTVTADEMAYWPLMHPIDVICGHYSYQCMSNPFTLRVDDLNALADLYPVWQSGVPPGKQGSDNDAIWWWGVLSFPTGQGMSWVNITTRRQKYGFNEGWQTTSSVTGFQYQQAAGTPEDPNLVNPSGSFYGGPEGYFMMRRVPLDGLANVFFTSEPINPLYWGDAAIGPYVRPPVTPSGSPTTMYAWSATSPGDQPYGGYETAYDAAGSCGNGQDGTETAPAMPDSSGWQSGQLCGWQHSSWWSLPVAAGHTWALEVTATDETGAATTNKAQPVLGVWNAGDATGSQPTVGSQPVAFNSMSLGMTQMQFAAPNNDSTYRISTTDQYGAGRPDFTYTARFLYAATVTPATVGSGGGQIVIGGMGFRQGNQVSVNGVAAHVVSWGATQIVADAPPMRTVGTQTGVPVTVTVADLSTGGSTTVPEAVSYTAAPDLLQVVSAPTAIETGVTAATPFAVRVVASDGLSPVAGDTVSFALVAGAAQMALCGSATNCTGVTDQDGIVRTTVVGGGVGAVTLQATEVSGGATVQVQMNDTDPVRAVSFDRPVRYAAAGVSGVWVPVLTALQDGLPAGGVAVNWSATSGLTAGVAQPATNSAGEARIALSDALVQAWSVKTAIGCVWSGLCATVTIYGVDPSQWTLTAGPGAAQGLSGEGSFNPVVVNVTDVGGHVLEGAPVEVYQRVLAWEGDCPEPGRCAAAPVLANSQTTLTSDSNGAIRIAPLMMPGVPQVLEIAVSTGTQGFLTLTLVKAP